MMHGSACTIRIIGIHCTGVIGAAMSSTTNIVNNNVHHRTSTAASGAFKATEAVPRAAVRGTAAVVVQITSSDAETEMWAELLVAIIVLMTVLQTGASGIITARRSRTVAIIGTAGDRQCDHRALYVKFTTTVRQSS